MSEIPRRILELLKDDPRFPLAAYVFVQEGLCYAQEVLRMGKQQETVTNEPCEPGEERLDAHLSGQQLCHAIRQYALDQYGLMARVVLKRMGIHTTGDIGDIVYNMIRIGEMKKSKSDQREDFDDVFDFEQAFDREFRIEPAR